MYDIIIIGGGIVGTTIARSLSKYNITVALLEKSNDVSMGATKANSAIVHGGYAEKHTSLKGKLCFLGRKQFAQLNEELNFGFRACGSLVITTEDDTTPLQALLENGIKNGLDDLEIIDAKRIQELEPILEHSVKWALYCKGAGVCSPYEMAIAMMENAIANGVELFLEHEVIAISKPDDTFTITTKQKEFKASYVINAAGIHADYIASMIGVNDFTILPRTGEYMLFTRGSGDAIKQVIFQLPTKLGKGVLLASTYYGNLLLGPDANDDATKEDTSTHVERLAIIYEQTKALYPKINPQQFIRSFTGIRARSSTDDFIIEESKVKGFINVAGIQSPGLTASPAIADMVVGLLRDCGATLTLDKNFHPFRQPIITKQPLRPLKEIQPLIDLPVGTPHRIVCRCEQVTEAEIVDAMHRGITLRTVDSIKRRTRATMGWCQGDFCKTRVIEIMEREYGIAIDPHYDIEHSGVSRVEKSELFSFLRAQNNN